MLTPEYQKAVQELAKNREQFRAYESRTHFVALAGPGSGKTKCLTTKMARILHEDVEKPRGVACVTYSNECARELKSRIGNLGVKPSRRVFIGTVHSFCFQQIVRPFAHVADLKIADPIRVANDIQIQDCFGDAVKTILGNDEDPWSWELPCFNHRRLCLDRGSTEWDNDKVISDVIEEYESNLRAKGMIDFDDMVLLGLRLVENHDWVRKAINAKYPVLVVDEYQDLGLPLHRLVLSLCLSGTCYSTRLFAVGDPDQSIYGFTGARPDLLQELEKRKEVESETLKLNYRSRQNLISASEYALGIERGYKSNSDEVGVVDFHKCENGLIHQAKHIVEKIIPRLLKEKIASSLGEIAVLYCTRKEGDVIDEQASAANLDFIRVDGNAAYPKTPITRWLEECALWCSAIEDELPPILRTIISEYLSFNQTLRTESRRLEASQSLVSVLRKNRGHELRLDVWLSSIADECLKPHLSSDPSMSQELVGLEKLLEATRRDGKLADWTVARFAGQGGTPGHLNLMTLHSSKGLEFEVAILFGMDQGIIPSYKSTTPESKREPRRLFYVGLTRARREVHFTYSGWRSTPWGGRKNDGISEFVVELQVKLNEEYN